ncbi:Maf family protein [Ferrovibrio xuzhouensis]|uniref:Nucleoside triphosphate pyrophosphatase n=1 Tax=Ferrovibrio xuzhouensis TaxID=1576914 RepID=A0ABV7VEH7_9PROT
MSLILASASTARAAMLRQAGLDFSIVPARVDETEIKRGLQAEGASVREAAEALAELKALRGTPPAGGLGDDSFVIGADQMLACDGRWYDKPADLAEARAQLLSLRGKTHELVSAVVLMRNGSAIWRHAETAKLTMRDFSDGFLDAYLAQAGDAVLQSVGCYQLEGLGVQLFSRIQGDFFTILGLPLLPLLDMLRNHQLVRT